MRAVEILRRLRAMGQCVVLGGTWVLFGPLGCLDGPSPLSSPPHPDMGHSSTSSASDSSGPGHTSHSTTDAADETGTTSADETGVVFLLPTDMGPTFQCDLFAQDCPPGEKCAAWANDGGNVWNASKCVPVVDDPAAVGEPCHVEGSGVSGIDDCDFGSMCFYVDPETMEGVCTPLCTGDESNPQCPPHRFCTITGSGVPVLCLPRCRPLEQDCVEGQACVPIGDDWDCVPDASGEQGAYGDPCEHFDVCDPGLVCLGSTTVPPGEACEGTIGCCTELCDVSLPLGDLQCAGAGGGQQCVPWYLPGAAPPGHEDVGVCTMP